MAEFSILDIETDDYYENNDGFSFTVKTELDAYKAAHRWQHMPKTEVRKVNGKWTVAVYNKPGSC